MTPLGHIGGSLMTAGWVERLALHRPTTPAALGLAVLVGLLPDADGLLALALGHPRPRTKMLPHHQYPTHTPAFWLLASLAVWLTLGGEAAGLFGALTLAHLLLDTWGTDDGIMWLWPLSSRQFALFPSELHADGLFGWQYYRRYIHSWRALAPEIILLAGGILLSVT